MIPNTIRAFPARATHPEFPLASTNSRPATVQPLPIGVRESRTLTVLRIVDGMSASTFSASVSPNPLHVVLHQAESYAPLSEAIQPAGIPQNLA
jgi:hypothetical protein